MTEVMINEHGQPCITVSVCSILEQNLLTFGLNFKYFTMLSTARIVNQMKRRSYFLHLQTWRRHGTLYRGQI